MCHVYPMYRSSKRHVNVALMSWLMGSAVYSWYSWYIVNFGVPWVHQSWCHPRRSGSPTPRPSSSRWSKSSTWRIVTKIDKDHTEVLWVLSCMDLWFMCDASTIDVVVLFSIPVVFMQSRTAVFIAVFKHLPPHPPYGYRKFSWCFPQLLAVCNNFSVALQVPTAVAMIPSIRRQVVFRTWQHDTHVERVGLGILAHR